MGTDLEVVMRGRSLIQMFGSEAAALKHTNAETTGYDSAADHAAIRAAIDDTEPQLMCQGGPPRQPHPAGQQDVPPGVWQASCTPEGAATVITSIPPQKG